MNAPQTTDQQNHGGPCENTDREIWRMHPESYYSPSIHVTVNGRIGMNVAGHVIVMPIEKWHTLARIYLDGTRSAPDVTGGDNVG
jgi:hypothetical protein